jgi:hypothetical protein
LLNGVPILPEYGESMPVFQGLPCYAIAEPAPGYRFLNWSNGETTERIDFSISSETSLTATFFPTGETLLPPIIGADRTLAADENYAANGSVAVPDGVTLTIEQGATLRLLPEADLRIEGALQILGTAEAPVRIEAFREGSPWAPLHLRIRRWCQICPTSSSAADLWAQILWKSVGPSPSCDRKSISITLISMMY